MAALGPDHLGKMKSAVPEKGRGIATAGIAGAGLRPQLWRRPGAARGGVFIEPGVATVACCRGRADQDDTVTRNELLEPLDRYFAVHPVQCAPDGHHIECADLR